MHLLLQADQRLKQDHEDVLLPAHRRELYLNVKDLDIESETYSPIACPVSKRRTTLLRHGHLPSRRRWSD